MKLNVEAKRSEDWHYLLNFLPSDWEQMAADSKAMLRFRGFSDAGQLLRTLLIHLLDGCSLRETAVHARQNGIADVSDVALLKRLNSSGEWFRLMAHALMEKAISYNSWAILPEGYTVRLVDATCISKPGSMGTDWRIHYSMELPTLKCAEILISDSSVGENLRNFKPSKKLLCIGDRGYSNRSGVAHIVHGGGDVLIRMNLCNLPLSKIDGTPFNTLKHLRHLSARQIGDWAVQFNHNRVYVKGRVCAIKKTKAAAEIAKEKIIKVASKKKKTPMKETLEAAEYIFLFTSLPKKILSASRALEVYRGRWQIELAFKRLKSLLELGNLPKQDPEGARSWIYGKLFAALLIETLIRAAENFFPWGFPIEAEPVSEMSLERNIIHA